MTPKERDDLERLLAALDDCDLTAWERDFVDDLSRRVIRYGEQTRLTGRQAEILRILEGKYT